MRRSATQSDYYNAISRLWPDARLLFCLCWDARNLFCAGICGDCAGHPVEEIAYTYWSAHRSFSDNIQRIKYQWHCSYDYLPRFVCAGQPHAIDQLDGPGYL